MELKAEIAFIPYNPVKSIKILMTPLFMQTANSGLQTRFLLIPYRENSLGKMDRRVKHSIAVFDYPAEGLKKDLENA